jgi:hypothetical protein
MASIAFASWASARLFDPAGGTDELLAVGILVAAGISARAAFALYALERGKTNTWAAGAWFAAAVVALFFLYATSFASHLTG